MGGEQKKSERYILPGKAKKKCMSLQLLLE